MIFKKLEIMKEYLLSQRLYFGVVFTIPSMLGSFVFVLDYGNCIGLYSFGIIWLLGNVFGNLGFNYLNNGHIFRWYEPSNEEWEIINKCNK